MTVLKQMALALAALIGTTFAAGAASVHDNYVYFWVSGLQAFSFAQTGYSISSGQPYQGTTSGISKPGAQGYILVKAGRHKTPQVAQWFKQQVDGGATMVCNSTGTFPEELNFAIEGTLTFTANNQTYTCEDFVLGQGSYLHLSNNWWAGGPHMHGFHVGPTAVIAQFCRTGEKVFTPATPCASTFSIGDIPH